MSVTADGFEIRTEFREEDREPFVDGHWAAFGEEITAGEEHGLVIGYGISEEAARERVWYMLGLKVGRRMARESEEEKK